MSADNVGRPLLQNKWSKPLLSVNKRLFDKTPFILCNPNPPPPRSSDQISTTTLLRSDPPPPQILHHHAPPIGHGDGDDDSHNRRQLWRSLDCDRVDRRRR
ncbi:hypothetical protein E3N88_28310 [Mikania micrantha]|uniref:Uncharacterized protein n=1 Tax=Mikania micrantha TaxID=192012 RepID=A0A5N6MZ38_9ASTR|nr:hypothetical protein E3N88_28310 [Mikania micrantha]